MQSVSHYPLSAASDCGVNSNSTPPASRPGETPTIVGTSAAIREVFDQVRRYATCDASVLIEGESGTGKDLIARAIHERSARGGKPFIAINCAALPASLIASELFGYEKGAFTGAAARKRGVIEAAHHGTLFLDEVGDMPRDLQGHLLRFLQEGEIVRVGGHEPVRVDVRVIAATNVKLREAIGAGNFREDLFYRLNVLNLRVPSLRERGDDVEMLALYFLKLVNHEMCQAIEGFAPAAMSAIKRYSWPGNVRELISTVRRAAVLCSGKLIEPQDLRIEECPAATRIAVEPTRPPPGSPGESRLLQKVLEEAGYNITKASHALQVSRVTFYRMLRRNHLALRQQCFPAGCDVSGDESDN